jgi:A/G-specific adenine glycosylase
MDSAGRNSPSRTFSRQKEQSLARALLAWYDRHRRTLPFRARPGEQPNPYHVWLSEIMLQQTTVAVVASYFHDYVKRWPTLEALAEASLDEVLHAWQGLGYYARARNLHRCARTVVRELGGRFPDTEAGLRALPGIGPYTAAAIAAIAFDKRATVVDGNVERVIARLFGVETPLPAAKAELRALATRLTPNARAGDYGQAVMDLGAVVCTVRRPRCILCPWRASCAARQRGLAETLPNRAPKRHRPVRRGVAFWLVRKGEELLIRRRPEQGLLGGLMEVPTTDWRTGRWTPADAIREAPAACAWRALPGIVRHGFTHFELELAVFAGKVGEAIEIANVVNEGHALRWCRLDRLSDYALPTVMKKVVEHALANGG